MKIKPIRTKRDYEAALRTIESLMHAKRNTPEGDKLDVLVTLVEAHEAKHFPLDLPDPVAAIKFVMEQRNLTAKDLSPVHRPNEPCLRSAQPQAPFDSDDGLEASHRVRDSSGIFD